MNTTNKYLACEHKMIFALLMISAGMMGGYTYTVRGGVFCNAQTANVVLMSIAFGQRRFSDGIYFLIPIFAYMFGAFISEALPSPVKKLGFLRWDTYLVIFETFILFIIGFIPQSAPHQITQVIINFIASMQYNTFRRAEGVPMATTFCTNHIRQVGVAAAKVLRKKDREALLRGLTHLGMICCFFAGGTAVAVISNYIPEKSIWLAVIPMLIVLAKLVYADTKSEHDLLGCTPEGH